MKVITLTQPWASLVAIGAKKIETRSWPTSYRGPIAIHAGKGLADMSKADFEELCTDLEFEQALSAHGLAAATLPRGAIVAVARLVMCIPTEEALARGIVNQSERAFGNFNRGRFAWFFSNVQQLAQPIPVRGALGLWDWQPSEDMQRALGIK